MKKIRQWLTKYKKNLVKMLMLLGILITIGVITLLILYKTNVFFFSSDDGIKFNTELFQDIKNKPYFVAIYILTQTFITVLLCFVPGTSMTFTLASVALFGNNYKCFLINFGGIILSSVIMDLIGRFGGTKVITWLIGREDYESALNLIKTKGETYVPVMYLLPVFPDDAICMCCGAIKLKFPLHLLYIVLCRGVGCATVIFGLNLIPYKEFNSFYEWFILGAVIIVYVSLLLKVTKYIDKKLQQFHNRDKNK